MTSYAFRAEHVVKDGVLTDSELLCCVAEGGVLYEVKGAVSVSAIRGEEAVISPQEAYDRLRAGGSVMTV